MNKQKVLEKRKKEEIAKNSDEEEEKAFPNKRKQLEK